MLRESIVLHEFKQRYPKTGKAVSAALLVPVIIFGLVVLLALLGMAWNYYTPIKRAGVKTLQQPRRA